MPLKLFSLKDCHNTTEARQCDHFQSISLVCGVLLIINSVVHMPMAAVPVGLLCLLGMQLAIHALLCKEGHQVTCMSHSASDKLAK